MCVGCRAAPLWSRPLRTRPYGRHRFISCYCVNTSLKTILLSNGVRLLHRKSGMKNNLVRVTLMWCFQGVGQPGLAGDQHFPSQAVHPDPLPRFSKRQLLGVQQQRLRRAGLRGHGEPPNDNWFILRQVLGPFEFSRTL